MMVVLILLSLTSCVPRPEAASSSAQSPSMPASSVTAGVSDALGRQYGPGVIPNRIVSLVPAVTEILFAIGAGEKVVGVTQYCDYPPEAKTRTSVGGFSGATMSLEQIRALRPDLVFLSADMHTRIISLLDELGIPSFAVEPRDFSQVYSTIALIGEVTGCGPGADTVAAGMKRKITGVKERIQGRTPPAVFWVLSEDPLMTAGSNTFVSEAITLAGGRNIFGDLGGQWPMVSPEQVLLRKPDWILRELPGQMSTLSGEAPPPVASPLWRNLPAFREGRVAYVNADMLYRYGPRLADAVEALAEIFHPGL